MKGIIDKIPTISGTGPSPLFKIPKQDRFDTTGPFKVLHGKVALKLMKNETRQKQSIIYQEFLEDQLKIVARRKGIKSRPAPIVNWEEALEKKVLKSLPYELTKDQALSVRVRFGNDFESGSPMMRMVQGDVGCGKTTVALSPRKLSPRDGGQTALMCPTESLALQHYNTFNKDASKDLRIGLLLGSHRPAEKREILATLSSTVH